MIITIFMKHWLKQCKVQTPGIFFFLSCNLVLWYNLKSKVKTFCCIFQYLVVQNETNMVVVRIVTIIMSSGMWDATGKKQWKTAWYCVLMLKMGWETKEKAKILAQENFQKRGNQLKRGTLSPCVIWKPSILHGVNLS